MFIRAEIQEMFVRIANREDPDQTASVRSLSWVCPAGLQLFGRQLVVESLEHLELR